MRSTPASKDPGWPTDPPTLAVQMGTLAENVPLLYSDDYFSR
jgi:hypothetical protein